MEAGNNSKWMKDCVRTASKGGFFRIWRRNDQGNTEWNLAYTQGDESVYTEKEWKLYINTRVEEFGLEKWRKDMERKQTLSMYCKKKCPKKEAFYDGSWMSSLLFKARSGSLELNERTHRFNDRRSKECEQGCRHEGRVVDVGNASNSI